MIDWLVIRNEYVNTSISYRKLAEKHSVSFATLQSKAKKENWKTERDKQYDKTMTKVRQKTQDKIVTNEVNRIERLYNSADKILSALEQATDELDKHIVRNKRKVKTIEYDSVLGKPIKEVVSEMENTTSVTSIIDKQGVKTLASALKDIKGIITGDGDENNSQDESKHNELMNAIKKATDNGN